MRRERLPDLLRVVAIRQPRSCCLEHRCPGYRGAFAHERSPQTACHALRECAVRRVIDEHRDPFCVESLHVARLDRGDLRVHRLHRRADARCLVIRRHPQRQHTVPAVEREVREADRRVVGPDHEADARRDDMARDSFRARGLTLVVGRDQRHFAAVPKTPMRIQLADGKPNAAELVQPIGRLGATLGPLDGDQQRRTRTRARANRDKRQDASQNHQEGTTAASSNLFHPPREVGRELRL